MKTRTIRSGSEVKDKPIAAVMTRSERRARQVHIADCRAMNCYPKPVSLWLDDYRRDALAKVRP